MQHNPAQSLVTGKNIYHMHHLDYNSFRFIYGEVKFVIELLLQRFHSKTR